MVAKRRILLPLSQNNPQGCENPFPVDKVSPPLDNVSSPAGNSAPTVHNSVLPVYNSPPPVCNSAWSVSNSLPPVHNSPSPVCSSAPTARNSPPPVRNIFGFARNIFRSLFYMEKLPWKKPGIKLNPPVPLHVMSTGAKKTDDYGWVSQLSLFFNLKAKWRHLYMA